MASSSYIFFALIFTLISSASNSSSTTPSPLSLLDSITNKEIELLEFQSELLDLKFKLTEGAEITTDIFQNNSKKMYNEASEWLKTLNRFESNSPNQLFRKLEFLPNILNFLTFKTKVFRPDGSEKFLSTIFALQIENKLKIVDELGNFYDELEINTDEQIFYESSSSSSFYLLDKKIMSLRRYKLTQKILKRKKENLDPKEKRKQKIYLSYPTFEWKELSANPTKKTNSKEFVVVSNDSSIKEKDIVLFKNFSKNSKNFFVVLTNSLEIFILNSKLEVIETFTESFPPNSSIEAADLIYPNLFISKNKY